MKKLSLLIFGIFLITCVLAIQQTIVETDITLKYNPAGDCIITCTNSTSSTNSTNITTQTCNKVCSGILRIEGENLLKEFKIENSSWTKTVENNVIRELGNETDITGILGKLDECLLANEKLNKCMDSNRNISSKLLIMEEDVGYKENYTQCINQKNSLNSQLESKNTIISTKEEEIESLKSGKWVWIIGAFVMGGLFVSKGLPYLKGRETPKDESEQQFPTNQGY